MSVLHAFLLLSTNYLILLSDDKKDPEKDDGSDTCADFERAVELTGEVLRRILIYVYFLSPQELIDLKLYHANAESVI